MCNNPQNLRTLFYDGDWQIFTVEVTLFKSFRTQLHSANLQFKCTQKSCNALRVQFNNILWTLLQLPRFYSVSGMFADVRMYGFQAVWQKKYFLAETECAGNGMAS